MALFTACHCRRRPRDRLDGADPGSARSGGARPDREPARSPFNVHLETGDSQQASGWFATYWLSHKIGILDCLIAATAVRLGASLYTFNTPHFQVIPGLDVRSPYGRLR